MVMNNRNKKTYNDYKKDKRYRENDKNFFRFIKEIKGLKIFETVTKEDLDVFYTVVNPFNNAHVHLKTLSSCFDTIRCFDKIKNFKCLARESHYCRIQALTLFYNTKIK